MAAPWPADAERTLLSRTEGQGRVVEEAVATYAHEGTGRTIRLPHVMARDDAGERLYFDGATVLVQAGLLDPAGLPVCGVVGFEDGRVAHEHIYWDHALALRQLGLLN